MAAQALVLPPVPGLPPALKDNLDNRDPRLVKTGGRLVKHARYYWLLLAEGHLSRKLFVSMRRLMAAPPLPDG